MPIKMCVCPHMKWHKTESMHVLWCLLFDTSAWNSNENDDMTTMKTATTNDGSGDGNDDDDNDGGGGSSSNNFPDGKSVSHFLWRNIFKTTFCHLERDAFFFIIFLKRADFC